MSLRLSETITATDLSLGCDESMKQEPGMPTTRPDSKPALRKELGQHHLSSGALVAPILNYLGLTLNPSPTQEAASSVLEIGPGGGVLTNELLRHGARVIAIELDSQWAFELSRRLAALDGGRFEDRWSLLVGDALDLDWTRLNRDHRVVGNLPYGIATVLLRRALVGGSAGMKLAFLVQLEVAQRICAVPGDAEYGALSVLVRARTVRGGGARLLGRVKPGSFVPPPKVDSAFVGLELAPPMVPLARWESFTRVVFAGFSQRRKTLRNALRNSIGGRYSGALLLDALERAGVGNKQRAEELDIPVWVSLWRTLEGQEEPSD